MDRDIGVTIVFFGDEPLEVALTHFFCEEVIKEDACITTITWGGSCKYGVLRGLAHTCIGTDDQMFTHIDANGGVLEYTIENLEFLPSAHAIGDEAADFASRAVNFTESDIASLFVKLTADFKRAA